MTIMQGSINKIDMIIWDLDQTLYQYWDGVARSFSEYTARSTCLLSKQYHGVYPDYKTVMQQALSSYGTYGLTTTIPAREYRLDEVELYRHHHQLLWDDYADREWHQAKIEHDIKDSFAAFGERNIRSVVLTHGTGQWGENVTGKIGIRDHFSHVAGIDSFGLRLKSRDKTLFADFMQACNIQPLCGNDYSNVMIVEDSPSNLVIPKRHFNMQTVLLKTARVRADFDAMMSIDRVIRNVSCLRKIILP